MGTRAVFYITNLFLLCPSDSVCPDTKCKCEIHYFSLSVCPGAPPKSTLPRDPRGADPGPGQRPMCTLLGTGCAAKPGRAAGGRTRGKNSPFTWFLSVFQLLVAPRTPPYGTPPSGTTPLWPPRSGPRRLRECGALASAVGGNVALTHGSRLRRGRAEMRSSLIHPRCERRARVKV